MKTERLQALATLLRSVPTEHFNLGSWRYEDGGGETATDEQILNHSCGTTACAIGWACAMPEFKKQGLEWGWANPLYTEENGDQTAGWKAVETFFDITPTEAQKMFSDVYYTSYEVITPTQVADRIEEFLGVIK